MYDIKDKIVNAEKLTVSGVISGTAAATATNYGKFFIAPFKCTVTSIKEVHGTAGTDGSAVTLGVERLQGTEALGSGDTLMTAVSLKTTKDTVQSATLTATTANLTLEAGDRLALVDTGTLTSVADVVVTVQLVRDLIQ